MQSETRDERERSETASDKTLEHSAGHDNARQEDNESPDDDGEKGEDGPPKPVGFWHKSLAKTRLSAFKQWAFLGMRHQSKRGFGY